ncbi:MAG: hypothetical protein WAO98_03225 [Alphaproteobacteria bacterium]
MTKNVQDLLKEILVRDSDKAYGFKVPMNGPLSQREIAAKQERIRQEFLTAMKALKAHASAETGFAVVARGKATEQFFFVVFPYGREGEPARRAAIQCFGPPTIVRHCGHQAPRQ